MKRPIIYTVAALMATTAVAQESKVAQEYAGWDNYRIGGYGEMVAKFLDYGTNRYSGATTGNTKEHRNTISIPRFVLAGDYKFDSRWMLGVEIEFEGGGTGSEIELESTENGEYETEMEKGGEVALEQFHITRLIIPQLNVRAGHLIVPVGLLNAHHEPINFFGTSRPEGEYTILPSTWHQTGLELFGGFGRGLASFDYEAMVVAGLNADGFGRDEWVSGGTQGLFEEDNFSSPAFVGRLNYSGLRGLRLGVSAYYCSDAGNNADKTFKYAKVGKIPVTILSADGQYVSRCVKARASVTWGQIGNADKVSGVVTSNLSPYYHGALRKTAKNALTYGGEVGVNLQTLAGNERVPVIWPFARYEYYNPQEKAAGTQTVDPRCQVSKWTLGFNWNPLPNLAVKADYTTRQIGTKKVFGTGPYNSENEFAIGVAYVGWFSKK